MLEHMDKTGQDLLPDQRKRLAKLINGKKDRAAYQQIRERLERGESIYESENESEEKLGSDSAPPENPDTKETNAKEDEDDKDDDAYVEPDKVANSDEDEEDDSEPEQLPVWERRFRLYQDFVNKTGNSDPQKGRIIKKFRELRHWATINRNRKDRLKKHQIQRLDELGFPWEKKREVWDKDHMIELIGELYQNYKHSRSSPDEPFKITQSYKAKDGYPVGQWYENQQRKDFRGLTESQQDRLGVLLEWDQVTVSMRT